MNKAIKILILSETIIGSALCVISPVFAIFIVGSIEGATVETAGIALAIALVVRSIARIPLGYYLDKIKGEYDDFYSLITGFLLFSFLQFLYIFAKFPIHVYLLQIVYGLAMAFVYTPWSGFFSRKLDKNHESFEWSVAVAISESVGAVASFLGGYIAQRHGFSPLFFSTGIIMLIGTFFIILSRKYLIRQ